MSLDRCKCGAIVDTDEDPDCYETGQCVCEKCRENEVMTTLPERIWISTDGVTWLPSKPEIIRQDIYTEYARLDTVNEEVERMRGEAESRERELVEHLEKMFGQLRVLAILFAERGEGEMSKRCDESAADCHVVLEKHRRAAERGVE